jgi:uncharacterized protein (DUF58 family)
MERPAPAASSQVVPAAVRGRALFDPAFHRRLELLALIARRVSREKNRAEHRSLSHGAGSEFAAYREYSRGDDFRRIDWNAYARVGRLLVRLYEQPADLNVHVLIDRSGSMGLGTPSKLAYAQQLAAALAYVGLCQLDRVGLSAFAGSELSVSKPARGKQNIFRIFEFLAALTPSGATDLAGALASFTRQQRRGGLAILLSDLYDPSGWQAALDRLRHARFESVLIQLLDPHELEHMQGELSLRDAESGQRRSVDITPNLLARFRAARALEQARLGRYCADKQVTLFSLSIATDPVDALLHVLRRGGLLR